MLRRLALSALLFTTLVGAAPAPGPERFLPEMAVFAAEDRLALRPPCQVVFTAPPRSGGGRASATTWRPLRC